jgi:hypothetical protein
MPGVFYQKFTTEELSDLGQWFDRSAVKSSVKKWQVTVKKVRIFKSISKENLLNNEQSFGEQAFQTVGKVQKRGIKNKEQEASGKV